MLRTDESLDACLLKPTAKLDAKLDDLLEALQVRLEAVAVCEISRPYCLVAGPYDTFVVHHVVRGHGLVELEGGSPVAFAADSMLLIPPHTRKRLYVERGHTMELRAEDTCTVTPDHMAYVDARGGAAAELTVVCGTIAADGIDTTFLDCLPRPLVEDMSSDCVVRLAFRTMLAERSDPNIGSRALIEALMKQCLLLLVRKHINRSGSTLSACLADRRLRSVAAHLQARGGDIESLDAVAVSAGMSRRRFSERFAALTGATPAKFARESRLQRAADLLRSTNLSVSDIAATTGYASRSHFSRVFHAAFGVRPNQYRTRDGTASAVEGIPASAQGLAVR